VTVCRDSLFVPLFLSSAGFGLGALNEAEDDDIDVYESLSHADRTYMPYDSTRDADESASLNQNKTNRKAVSVSVGCNSVHYTPGTNYWQVTTTQQKFSNGIIVLSGFVLSPEPGQKDQW
jgi:G patch domain-containing protein 1